MGSKTPNLISLKKSSGADPRHAGVHRKLQFQKIDLLFKILSAFTWFFEGLGVGRGLKSKTTLANSPTEDAALLPNA